MNLKQCDNFIANCATWDEFYEEASQMDNKAKGDAFERLTQLYLKTCPEYASTLKEVWWQGENLPREIQQKLALPNQDEGIDLIAETYSGEFWAIQCKFRTDQSKALTYKELSTFSSLSFVTCNDISLALVVHTTTKPVRKRKLLPNMTEIGLDRWLELSKDDWERITALCKHEKPKLEKRTPRPHQMMAIKDAKKHFGSDKQSRGKLIMPCGTGKSLTAFWIADALKAKTIIVAVPSLALVRQSLNDWTREFLAHGITPNWYCFCSDESTGKLDADEFVGSTYDLGIPADTSKEKVTKFLRKRNKSKKIIFTTYQSGPKLAEITKEIGCKFDLGIFDEAHKTVGDKSKAFAMLLFDENVFIKKRLFMTATERVLRGRSDDVISMDDKEIYGSNFHLLTFKQAINQKLISDYKIITMTVTTSQIEEIISENKLLNIGADETDALMMASGIALKKVFKKHNVHHAITFHNTIKKADDFSKQQDTLNSIKDLGPRSENSHISSKKSTGDRAKLLKEFAEAENAVISNARCLTEGVDIPSIDCVLFADPKQSVVDIVQASGRALRNFEGKDFGYIVLPIVVPDNMEFDEFAEQTAFKNVARIITSLSIQDERIAEEFKLIHSGKPPSGKIIEIESNVAVGMKMNAADFAEAVSLRVWKNVGRANWRPFKEARDYARSLKFSRQSDWFEYTLSGDKPQDIPASPVLPYEGSWINWGDWLGTFTIATSEREYCDYSVALAFVRKLKLKNFNPEWREYCAGKRSGLEPLPDNIPANPNRTYSDNWTGWGDWLGTGIKATHLRDYLPFTQAREFVRKLELKSEKGGRIRSNSELTWRNYKAGNLAETKGLKPDNIPATPTKVYDKEWSNWPDWLGNSGKAKDIEFWDYERAREFVLKLGLNKRRIVRETQTRKNDARNKWNDYCQGYYNDLPIKPVEIPSSIHYKYKNKGFNGYGHFITPD